MRCPTCEDVDFKILLTTIKAEGETYFQVTHGFCKLCKLVEIPKDYRIPVTHVLFFDIDNYA